MSRIRIDIPDLDKQLKRIQQKFGKEFQSRTALALEKSGIKFLDIVQDTIIRKQVVDTRLLLNSFTMGGNGNVWQKSNGGLTLQIGTSVEYAQLVNDGHWTLGNKISGHLADGRPYRWVPGTWNGGKFKYNPSADTGMVLTQKWVEGRHYWEDATAIFQAMFPEDFRARLEKIVKDLGD